MRDWCNERSVDEAVIFCSWTMHNVKSYVIMEQGENFSYPWLLCESGLPLHSSSPPLAERPLGVPGLGQDTAGAAQKMCYEIWDRVVWEAEQRAQLARHEGFEKGWCEPVAAVFDQSGERSQEELHAKQGNNKRLVEPLNQHCEKQELFSCEETALWVLSSA